MRSDITDRGSVAICAPQPYWDDVAEKVQTTLNINVTRVRSPEELHQLCERGGIDVLFFPHWSWVIAESIHSKQECIMFHMTDLPFGRGGTPLQNLISRGFTDTKISAFRCQKELDAGPIYLKRSFALDGSAQEILISAASLIEAMILEILKTQPTPQPQVGDVVNFDRRKPDESRIDWHMEPNQLFDHIRMLDADYYPRAFAEINNYSLEFSDVSKEEDTLIAKVKIINRGVRSEQ